MPSSISYILSAMQGSPKNPTLSRSVHSIDELIRAMHPYSADTSCAKEGVSIPVFFGFGAFGGNFIALTDIDLGYYGSRSTLWIALAMGKAYPPIALSLPRAVLNDVCYQEINGAHAAYFNDGTEAALPPFAFHDRDGTTLVNVGYLPGVVQLFFAGGAGAITDMVSEHAFHPMTDKEGSQYPQPCQILLLRNMTSSPITNPQDTTLGYGTHPAAAIYDILTNAQWGLGVDTAYIDEASFDSVGAGINLYINMVIEGATEARSVIDSICNACDLGICIDSDGLIKLKDIGTRPTTWQWEMDDDDYLSFSIGQAAWSDTSNVVTGTYRAIDLPIGGSGAPTGFSFVDASITMENSGAIEMAGRKIEKKIDLDLFANKTMAALVAKRKLQKLSFPKAYVTVEVRSGFYAVECGDLVHVVNAEYSIDALFRVLSVDFPENNSNTMAIDMEQASEAIMDDSTPVAVPEPEGEVPQYYMPSYQTLTFPAFSNTSTQAAPAFGTAADVRCRFTPGQEQTGDLTNGVGTGGVDFDMNVAKDRVILDPTKFLQDIQANALGLLSIDVWEV